MNDNILIRVFGLFAIVCVAAGVGIIFNYDGDKAQAFGLLGGLILLFIPSLLGFKKSADAAAQAQTAVTKVDTIGVKVDKSAVVSKQNSDTLAVIAPQITEAVSQATDAATNAAVAGATAQQAVHVAGSTQAAVNGRMDQYEQLANRVGSLQAQLAAALARIDEAARSKQQADAAFDRGVDLGRELPAAPPAEPQA